MRVVLDTNVLLSALISPHGPSDAIYRAWRAARFEVVTAEAQLDELRRASRYPKFKAVLQPHHVGAMVNNLQRAVVLERLPSGIEANDPSTRSCSQWPLPATPNICCRETITPVCCSVVTSAAHASSRRPRSALRRSDSDAPPDTDSSY